jgi:hypothetical protein
MAITWYYCKAGAEAASVTGSGTSGDPYVGNPRDAIQAAIDDAALISSGGRGIRLSNEAVFTWYAGDSDLDLSGIRTNDGRTNPTIFEAWDNGGSITVDLDILGTIAVGFEINGASVATNIFGGSTQGLEVRAGKIYGSTADLIEAGLGSLIDSCALSDCGSLNRLADSVTRVQHSFLNGAGVRFGVDNGIAQGCYFKDFSDASGYACNPVSFGSINFNIFDECVIGVSLGGDDETKVSQNTFYYTGASTSARGVVSSSSGLSGVASNNVFVGYSATGAKAIECPSGAFWMIVSNNRFYDCDTEIDESGTIAIQEDNSSESANPLTDPGNGDFSVKITSDSYQMSRLGFGTALNVGADQKDNAAGGGGGSGGRARAFSY